MKEQVKNLLEKKFEEEKGNSVELEECTKMIVSLQEEIATLSNNSSKRAVEKRDELEMVVLARDREIEHLQVEITDMALKMKELLGELHNFEIRYQT